VSNKAHLVAQGYNQVEGLDFGETFTHVAYLVAIRILLAFIASKGFKGCEKCFPKWCHTGGGVC
jgi:hypothetical protein